MTTAPADEPAPELLDRIRASLNEGHLREVRMFGAIAVMVDDSMAVAVHKDGSILVRVDPSEDRYLLARPGASRAEMGVGRSMGEGWRVRPTMANRQPAFALYWRAPGEPEHRPFGIGVLSVDGGAITELAMFIRPDLFRHFALPARP